MSTFNITPHTHRNVESINPDVRSQLVAAGKITPPPTEEVPRGTESLADAVKLDGTETPETEKGPEDASSTRFAQLSKREQQLRQQMKDLKAREEAIQAQETEKLTAKSFAEKVRKAPLEALQEAGISVDELLNIIANGPQPDSPTTKLERELQALKDKIEQNEKAQTEKQSKSYETAINQIRSEVTSLVSGNDDFETIAVLGQEEAVVEHIKDIWEKEQRLVPTADAAKHIEEMLLEEAMKLANVKKFKQKLSPLDVSEGQDTKSNQSDLASKLNESRSTGRTLTNASATATKPLTAYDRAVLAFKGQLNQ